MHKSEFFMLDQHKNYAIFIYLSTRTCIHFFQFAANSLEYVCVSHGICIKIKLIYSTMKKSERVPFCECESKDKN
jgi:hypothetical protein